MSNMPWMKFSPADWRGDQALRAVSIAARGLWIECLCIMHEAKPYGHLVLNGNPVDDDTLARMTGVPVDEVSALMTELRQAGVLSVTGKGVVFSRRMTKDHARAQKGRKAANQRWAQPPDNKQKSGGPNGLPNRVPITKSKEVKNTPQSPPAGGTAPDDALFEEIWKVYPRAPNSNQRAARRQFNMLTPDQRKSLLKAAQRFRAWWIEDCRKRGETQDVRLRYVAHLATWVQNGAWESADDLPVYGGFEAKRVEGIETVDRYRDPKLFAACEQLHGASVTVTMQKFAFPADLVARARQQLRSAA